MDRPEHQADRRRLLQLGHGTDWIGWNRTILQHLRNHVDYLSLHTYVGNRDNDYYEFMASSIDLDDRTRDSAGHDRLRLSTGTRGNRKIYIAWDEWNVWYRARGEASSAAAAFSKSATTSKTRWWSRRSSTPSSTTRTS